MTTPQHDTADEHDTPVEFETYDDTDIPPGDVVVYIATGVKDTEISACPRASWTTWIHNGGPVPQTLVDAIRAAAPSYVPATQQVPPPPNNNSSAHPANDRMLWATAGMEYVGSTYADLRNTHPNAELSEGWVIY